MDYKRNKKYFSPTFKRNMIILAVLSIVLAAASYVVWWYILYYEIIAALIVVFAGLAIAAFSMLPKDSYLLDQIEEQIEPFRTATADKLKLPSDLDDNSLVFWGFCPGTAEKAVKNEVRTDRVCYSMCYMKRSELYVRTRRVGLLAAEESVEEYHLPFDSLTTSVSDDEKTLVLTDSKQTVELPIREKDYNLEQFLEKIAHRQQR